MKINIKRLAPNAIVPQLGTPGAAAVDLCAIADGWIRPDATAIVDTGIAIAIPKGFYGQIASRSSTAAKRSTIALGGVIDSDYRGQIKVILHNLALTPFYYTAGERIAQMVFLPCAEPEFVIVDELEDTARGEGGFGSTGKVTL